MEGKNVGTKGGKSRKQGLISANYLPIELSEFTYTHNVLRIIIMSL